MLQRFLNIFKSKKQEETEPEPELTILVLIKIKPEFRQEVFDSLKNDEDGIKLTKAHKGCVSAEGRLSTDDEETIAVWGRWTTRQDHEDYMKMRTDSGYFDKVGPKFASPPVFIHLSKDSF